MLPSRHIIVSLPLGASVWFFTRSVPAALLCFLTGTIVDADHLIEYAIHHGFKRFNFKEIYQACRRMTKPQEKGGVKKIYLFFHAIEISILLWVVFVLSKNIYILSMALGYTGHLALDVAANEIKPWAYFISARMKNGFRTIKIIKFRQPYRQENR